MKTLWKLSWLYCFGATCMFITISIHNFGSNDWKNPIYFGKIYPNYYDDDLHSEWPFVITKTYKEANIRKWSEPKKLENNNPDGIGEIGAAFVPPDGMNELMEQLINENNYNLLASEMISLHRSLPDVRFEECKRLSYPDKLPTTSVIIIFHNEAWSTLLRTVWSVIDRSPAELIEEIILVDDVSTSLILQRPLQDYIELLPVRTKLIRTSKREGLIRARLIGAEHATGNVLTFLDGHIECTEGWLQPLLARIANDRSVVAVPLADIISIDDMSYYANKNVKINGFTYMLYVTWMSVPERELIRTHYDNAAPKRTPAMVGCSFSIDREFFFEIGSYDKGMDIWGSENMEMSFRVWQCGGAVEIIPCSHVGHLYRHSTYSFNGDKDTVLAVNNVRLMEVWMTDVKEVIYGVNKPYRNVSAGNINERQALKKRLKCKNFRWYLDNVYPEKKMLQEYINFGEIKLVFENRCLDMLNNKNDEPLGMYDCHETGGNQFFVFTKNGEIITIWDKCVGVNKQLRLVKEKCTDRKSQMWKYDNENKWIIHIESGFCMMANKDEVIIEKCDSADDNFKWEIKAT